MKKFLLSLFALLIVMAANANVTVDATWGTPASNGSWDSVSKVYTWTLNYSNLATVFETPNGVLANYTALHLTTEDFVEGGQYRVCFMQGGNALATIAFYSAGQKDLVFAERNETKDLDLSLVDHISFGGASNAGSIKVTKMFLEGPDPVTPKEPSDSKEPIYTIDYTTYDSFPFYVMGYTPEFNEDGLNSSNPGGWYQYFAADDIKTEIGADYKVVAEIWCDKSGSFNANMGWGWGAGETVSTQVKVTADKWTYSEFSFYGIGGTSCNIVFQPGGFDGVIKIKNLKVYKIEQGTNQCLKVVNPEIKTESYGTQLFYVLPKALTQDTKYSLSMRVMFEKDYAEGLGFWPYAPGAGTQYTGFGGSYTAGEWKTITCNFTANGNHTMLQFPIGHVDGTMYIDDVVLTAEGSVENLVNNGSLDKPVSHLSYSAYGNEAAIAPDTWWSWSWALPEVSMIGVDDIAPAPYTIATTAGKIGTIVLDYPASIEGATLYEVVGFSTTTGLELAEVEGDMVGGTPYIYVASAAQVVCTKKGASVEHGDFTDENVGNGLRGMYVELTPSTWWFDLIRENGYIISNNKLRNIAKGNVTIPANRCFFDSDKCTSKSAATKLVIAPEEATAINNVNAALEDGKIYDMNGREVKSMKKGGIYVVGGMKVSVK